VNGWQLMWLRGGETREWKAAQITDDMIERAAQALLDEDRDERLWNRIPLDRCGSPAKYLSAGEAALRGALASPRNQQED
jgi:hypothetical protein